jgi:hypothetical protein
MKTTTKLGMMWFVQMAAMAAVACAPEVLDPVGVGATGGADGDGGGERPVCGNDTCEAGEDASTCAADCWCGNGSCEPGEDVVNCLFDCRCGDSVCGPGEDALSCPHDCGCGDGACGPGEDGVTCPHDCTCGDGLCDPNETDSCSEDCACENGAGDTRCGTAGHCDGAQQFCAHTTDCLGTEEWECIDLPAGCEDDRTCGCLRATFCPADGFNGCGGDDCPNVLSCAKGSCGQS